MLDSTTDSCESRPPSADPGTFEEEIGSVMSESGINRIVLPKSANLLSDRLRDMILRGNFAPGDLLPAERALVQETGLSRGSVREALRILETEGLVEITRGRSGGIRVSMPKRDMLTRSVELFVRANAVSLSALLDCRAAIEPMLARLAARHRTAAELAELEDLHQRFADSIEDLARYRSINYRWHLKIAECSRNEPLTALIQAILTTALEATAYEKVTTPPNRQRAIEAHSHVMEAIRRQDAEAAADAMETHLTAYSKLTQAAEQ